MAGDSLAKSTSLLDFYGSNSQEEGQAPPTLAVVLSALARAKSHTIRHGASAWH